MPREGSTTFHNPGPVQTVDPNHSDSACDKNCFLCQPTSNHVLDSYDLYRFVAWSLYCDICLCLSSHAGVYDSGQLLPFGVCVCERNKVTAPLAPGGHATSSLHWSKPNLWQLPVHFQEWQIEALSHVLYFASLLSCFLPFSMERSTLAATLRAQLLFFACRSRLFERLFCLRQLKTTPV